MNHKMNCVVCGPIYALPNEPVEKQKFYILLMTCVITTCPAVWVKMKSAKL